jgi:phosphoethanolamine N-methyltransferase
VEQPVLDKAAAGARETGLADRARFQLVEPGPLPFEDGRFDVVFSKDAIIHVPDKPALFRDILRVLRPGGWVVLSDWFRGDQPFSREMTDWISALGLTFSMALLDDTAALLAGAGFAEVSTRDRNAWYAERSRQEVAQMAGPDRGRLMVILGEKGAHNWIERARLKSIAVGQGHLRPGHLRGRKP